MIGKRLINTGVAAAGALVPSEHFETVTYTGNGGTQRIGGYINRGGVFNGSSSYILAPAFMPTGSAARSVSAWVKTTVSNTNMTILMYGTGGTNNYFIFRILNGKLGIAFYANDHDFTATGLTDGNWHHAVVTYDGSSAKVYLDGSLIGTGSAGAVSTNSNNVAIGGYSNGVDALFNGSIDQVRTFNKALSSSEVTTLYGETSATASTFDIFSDSSAVALYQLDGDARDTGNLYDGTATNVSYAYNGTATNVTYQEATKFQPDLVWIKGRDTAGKWNVWYDSVRGAGKMISSNQTDAETTYGGVDFETNGFSVTSAGDVGSNGENYVAWTWKAGGAAVSNTDGSITSQVSANQDAGFSIVTWTGSGIHTIGHGLNTIPEMIIVKRTSSTGVWITYHANVDATAPEDYYLQLNSTAGRTFYTDIWQSTAPTSSIFTLYDSDASQDYVAYCFHSVEGFSKIGSYTGTGTTTGEKIITGFEPAFVMTKRVDAGSSWYIADNKRNPSDPRNLLINVNVSDAEIVGTGTSYFNFYENGFQLTASTAELNANGGTYIYLAIAADPDTTTPVVENSFDVVTYTGDGTSTRQISTDFKPDLVWIKVRNEDGSNFLQDSVRGKYPTSGYKPLLSNSNITERDLDWTEDFGGISSLNPNGFTVYLGTGNPSNPDSRNFNNSGNKYVAWCWKAGDHDDNLPQINTEGTIDSIVSVNAAAGFSIVKFTKTGGATQTNKIGHGLSSAPEMIILKRIDGVEDWYVYHTALGASARIQLNSSAAQTTGTGVWNQTSPTSTVFDVKSFNDGNAIAYCFHSVSGYQKVGSYTGNNSSGGQTITGLGFNPRFLLVKHADASAGWRITDKVRGDNTFLYPNLTNADDSSSGYISLITDGFRLNGLDSNASGTYIYLAIK